MTVEVKRLLIIKQGPAYIRVTDNGYTTCNMDKASVFPESRIEEVLAHVKRLNAHGKEAAAVYQLTITETPYVA